MKGSNVELSESAETMTHEPLHCSSKELSKLQTKMEDMKWVALIQF